MPNEKLASVREKVGQIADVNSTLALLQWDQEVFMPVKGGPARGQQLSTLSAIAHRMLTDSELGDLLKRLSDDDSLSDDEAKLVSETLYDYQRATCLPESFVAKFAREQSKAYHAWVTAREDNDFNAFRPRLETMVDLLKQKAEFSGYEGSPYNALLEDYEPGMDVEQLNKIFSDLARQQSALVEKIVNAPDQPDVGWLDQEWDCETQLDITVKILKDMGYDFDAGRQDKSVHPFTTNFDLYDVRVTTRVHPRELFSALTGSMHEGGHGLYEQGFLDQDRRSTLAQAPSLGIHESQSRLWENMIGRSEAFWNRYTLLLRECYPGQLDKTSPEQMYRAINIVKPSLIRVESDECTYNLHIIMRYEIETALIEERIKVREVPDLWNAKMNAYLGVDVPDDASGCLQDIHWSHGSMGYFPTYALGNLYAAQLFEQILEDVPDLMYFVEQGRFSPLLDWLREHVHHHGRRKTAREMVRDATGKEPSSAAYFRYLDKKYSALYRLE